jgi:uncharacterized protein YqgC (DUF456 family)
MDLVIQILAVILGIAGLLGCILPVLPGPPLSFIGLVLLFFKSESTMAWPFLLLWGIIAVVVTVLDYLVPAYFTKIAGGSRAATRFALAGMLLGIVFFPPLGMIIGAFLGALLGEILYNRKEGGLAGSLKPAFGSFLGFLFGVGLKLVASGIMMYYIVIHL